MSVLAEFDAAGHGLWPYENSVNLFKSFTGMR